jgi:hypothetical protein
LPFAKPLLTSKNTGTMNKYRLTLKFDKARKASETVEAKDRADLDKVIERKPFWWRNKDRITIEQLEIKR